VNSNPLVTVHLFHFRLPPKKLLFREQQPLLFPRHCS